MDKTAIRRVVRTYQLEPEAILTPQKGYRNQSWPIRLRQGDIVNFIIYKDESSIAQRIIRANSVADYAAQHDMPARQTLSPRILRLQTSTATRYGALYTYLPGHTIPWEAYTKQHIKLLGLAMGRLHAALQSCNTPLPHVTDEYRHILAHMIHYFEDQPVRQAMATKLGLQPRCNYNLFDAVLTHCTQLPDQQPLHMDFVRGNILFSSPGINTNLVLDDLAISGILDFEKTAFGHPQFDLARTLAFLLVDCKYKSQCDIRKYFLHSGYAKRSSQKLKTIPVKTAGTSRPLLEILVDLFLLYDFYKFLRHNPYEYLQQNEHFVRTKNILRLRGLIRDI